MLDKEHLRWEGLGIFVAIKGGMFKGLSRKLKAAFPNLHPVARTIIHTEKIPDPFWVAGFTTGEGCFFLNIGKDSNMKLGYRITVGLQITQHIRDKDILVLLETYFSCGKYYLSNLRRHRDYIVFNLKGGGPWILLKKLSLFLNNTKWSV